MGSGMGENQTRRIIDHHVPHIDNIHIRRAGFTANPGTNAPQNPFYTLAMHKQFLHRTWPGKFHHGIQIIIRTVRTSLRTGGIQGGLQKGSSDRLICNK